METKTCKECGRELALSEFRLTRGGARCSVCNGCANDKRAQTRYERAQTGGGVKRLPFPTRTSTTSVLAKLCA